ncbi:response regulator [Desulfovibrio sp.]|uniref:response regulator n=1 Tax=Desulfovibrio sp. TaxID=885 RepID=UPI0023C5FD47|nr:response regulator [Desulfovibrio sp.]MDE7241716.1 response regulator [Desulfovibrio sp.]
MALVVLAALLFLAVPGRAADALLPGAQPGISPDVQTETVVAPALAALQASRPAGARQQQPMLPSRGAGPSLSLLPYLDYLLDESGTLDIEEAAAPDRATAYAPLALEKLPRAEGVMWLRFTLAPLAGGERPQTLLLDMGASIPGTPMLYEPERNDLSGALEWRESSPAPRNVLVLPEAGAEPLTCYIRLDGLPGLWFSPLVRTPADAATNWGSLARTGAILALGVVMLLCLLRWLSESGQWRVWTALYVAVALGQALLGMPEAGSAGLGLGKAAATLAPGIALMLLPHVGRHLMRTHERARSIDIQLFLLSFPGAALALLPLLPGWAWLDRWLDLWPAATIIFVPTALGAWIMGLGGARRFLLGCLLPPLFVAAGVLGLDFGFPANLLASAPLWGTALSALLIAATGAPADMAAPAAATSAPGAMPGQAEDGGIITLEHPLDDPNLRLVSGGNAAPAATASAAGAAASAPGEPLPEGISAERARAEAREGALRAPLDDLLREGAALEQCALPPAVRQYASAMLAAARRMADVLSQPDAGGAKAEGGEHGEAPTAFDLQRLLREAHGAVAPAAEYAGIGLAWYMPPHLGQLYRGDARTLGETLGLLLESAVRATRQGAVHLSARRVPESSDAGNILFTVTDTGTGAPPTERSSLALARAWELAARHGGYVGMEYGPNGTTIAFSLHLEPLEDSAEDLPGEGLPHVIVVAEDAGQRRELARMAADLPCRCSEAASEHEALRRHEADPAVLLVAHGRYALPAAADMVTKFMEIAAEAGLSGCKVLAVTEDDSQWNLLADSGFTHALLEPVDAEALRQTVRDVIRNARRTRPAAPKAPEKGADAPREEAAAVRGEEAAEAPETDGDLSAPVEGDTPAGPAPVPAEEMPAVREKAPAAPPEPEAFEAQARPETRGAGGEAGHAPASEQPEASAEAEETPAVEEIKGDTAEIVTDIPADAEEEPAPATEEKQEVARADAEPVEAPGGQAAPAPVEAPLAEAGAPETPQDAGGASPAPAADAPLDPEPETGPAAADATFMAHEAETGAGEPEMESGEPVPAPDASTPREERPAPEAAPAAPEEAPTPAPATAPRPTAGQAARASVYVSPALASPGEWVGEPMPIGTPVPRRETPEAAPEARREAWRRPEARADAAPRQEAPACQRAPARSSPGGYTSPSVPVPGEWVGEPMPIPRKPTAPAPEEAVAPAGAAQAVAGPTDPETAAQPASTTPVAEAGGSLMDFIVGATRVEAVEPEAPARQEAEASPSGGMTDFVERSVTLVTSAVSSAFAPAPEGDAAAAPQAGPGLDGPEAPAAATASGGASGDAAILALVARLDAAMAEANSAHAAGRGHMVAQAAAKIAEESESFGFRVLARMARCVERAGRAGDMNALRDLLPELAVSVERNRIALTQQHK